MNTSFILKTLLAKRSQIGFDPVRSWLIILFVSLLAFSIIVVWHMWVFDQISSGEVLGGDNAPPRVGASDLSLAEIEEIIEARAEKMEAYAARAYATPDPSR